MVAAALSAFANSPLERRGSRVYDLRPTLALISAIQSYHGRQYRPRVVAIAVLEWLRAWGGRPDRVMGRMRIAGAYPDPHVLCFGPGPNRKFFHCLVRAHAVAPYRIEVTEREWRVYVYDPNHPGDRGRCVSAVRDERGRFDRFSYDGFGSEGRWGVSLLPLSAIGDTARPARRKVL